MLDWLPNRGEDDEGTEYDVDYQRTVSAFGALLDSDGMAFDGEKSELLDEFDDIVSRYDDISSEIERAANEVTEDGEVTLWDTIGNDRLPEWQRENQAVVTEIEALDDQFEQLIDELDPDESKIDEAGPLATVNSFYEKLNNASWLTE